MQPHVSNCHAGWYGCQPCGPCGSCACGGMWPGTWGYPCATPQAIAWAWCPCQGAATTPPAQTPALSLPKELEVNSEIATAEAVVGGTVEAQVFVEYMKEVAADPGSITVTVTSGGVSSIWEETDIADGYHVKSDLPKVSPGSKIRLEVNNALARARWLEVAGAATTA